MDAPSAPEAHPLAVALAKRLRNAPNSRILEIGAGNGRNTRFLQDTGFHVTAVADICASLPAVTAPPYDAALSTHAFLHGTLDAVRTTLDEVFRLLQPNALVYATFGSTHDARYGTGTRLEDHVFAADTGEEAGVPHIYFTAKRLRAALEPHVIVESLHERNVDAIVGGWAHRQQPRGSVHWFLIGRVRACVSTSE